MLLLYVSVTIHTVVSSQDLTTLQNVKFKMPRNEEFLRELLNRSWAYHAMKIFRFTMLGNGRTRAAASYYTSVYVLTTDVCAVVCMYVLNACVTSELGANRLFTLDYHPEPIYFNANPPTLVFCTVGSSSPVLLRHQSCGFIAAEKPLLLRGTMEEPCSSTPSRTLSLVRQHKLLRVV